MTKFAGEHLDIQVAVTLSSWERWAVKHAMGQPNQALMPNINGTPSHFGVRLFAE